MSNEEENRKTIEEDELQRQRLKSSSNKYKHRLVAYLTPTGIVSEGSRVQLDGSGSYFEIDSGLVRISPSTITTRAIEDEDGVYYLWKQIDGPKVTLKDEDTPTPSFIAPLVDVDDSNNNINRSDSRQPKLYTRLKFQLVIKDREGLESKPAYQEIIVKIVQRALVLQGGGALGAYEVGVFKALCENLIEKRKSNDKDKERKKNNGRPLFDIVAGTSIGAVNAAVIVGSVLRHTNKNTASMDQAEIWINAVKELERFWDDISNPLTIVPKWIRDSQVFESWWNNWKSISEFNNSLLSIGWNYGRKTREAWNEYYKSLSSSSSKEISQIRNNSNNEEENSSYWWLGNWPYIPVLREEWPYIHWMRWKDNWKEEWPYIQSYFYWPKNYGPPATVEAARRYYSYTTSLISGVPRVLLPAIQQPDMTFFGSAFTRFDNTPLARTIKKYWDYEKFPIKTSFKDLQPRLILVSVDMLDASSAVAFDSYSKENDICRTEYGDEEFKHVIEYPDGITMDHVMASMSTHLKHRYPQMKVKYNDDKGEEEQPRLFWDGAYLSNTPLKELLHEHRYYWHKVKKEKVKLENAAGGVQEEEILIPDLEIYIINLYPSVENEVPMNADAIQDREIDIKFHDRTKNDVKYAQLATDYIELIEQIRNLGFKHAQSDEDFKKDYDALLNKLTKSKKRTGIRRKYKDLLEGRSDITRVVYVDRSDDGNTVFGKAFEFSSNTVNQLERAGYEDAEIAIEIESVRDAVINLITNGIVTQEEGLVFEEKLQAAIAHAKHKDIDKSRDKLTELVKIAIAIVEGKTSQKEITREMLDSAQLFGSAQLLDLQLMISQNTLMVNKGLMSQNEADILKEKLQAAKRTIKDQIAVAKRRGENS